MTERRPTGAEINQIAGDWLAREDAGALTSAERAELDAWLAAESRHLGAYIRLRAASKRLDRLAALRGGDQGGLADDPPREAPAPTAERPSRRIAIAAALAGAVVLSGGAGYWAWLQPRTYQTEVGEMRRVTLDDGSVISLNTDTLLRVDYSKTHRDIWLKRGEGHFIVAKDRTRPFVVHTNDASVTAVGTAFTVRAEARRPVRVTVTEGVVSVAGGETASARPAALVGAMQEAALPAADAQPKVTSISLIEADRRLAWTSGRIMLEGQTLGEAAAEFNRYNERKLIVSPDAAPALVGGVFRTSEVETFARTAAPSLGLSIRIQPNGDILIEGRPSLG